VLEISANANVPKKRFEPSITTSAIAETRSHPTTCRRCSTRLQQHADSDYRLHRFVAQKSGTGKSHSPNGIVKQSGGNIWVYSEQGLGTVFKVYLPRIDDATASAIAKQSQETNAPRGTETILLVEDEEVVRGLTRKILMQAGYNVLDAKGGDEAIRLCSSHAGPIDLLLTDVVMPEISGKEVADRLVELRSSIRVLCMSGYTDEAIVQHGVLDANVKFIQKPFTWVGLTRKVRDVLNRKT